MINVTCAIIRNDDEKILVVQRSGDSDHPLKWEFPGGKVKEGEDYEDCIVREINEELSLDIIITRMLAIVEHDYGDRHVRLIPFTCDTLLDLPVLNEHADFRWVDTGQLLEIDFLEADKPVAREYVSKYGQIPAGREPESGLTEKDRADIREVLTAKSGYGAIDILAESAVGNSEMIKVLLEYSLGKDKGLAFRSAYTILKAYEKKPGTLSGYYSLMVASLPSLKNESVIRSFLNIFISAGAEEFNEREQGILADCCFRWLGDRNSAIAIKAYSMEILYQLSLIYPELSVELVASIKHNMEEGSAGVKARGQMILNRLEKG